MDAETKKSLMKIMLAMRAANGDPLPPELEPMREKLAKMAVIRKGGAQTSPSTAEPPKS